MNDAPEAVEEARAAADSLLQLARAALTRLSTTPDELDAVLPDLAAAATALARVTRQLSDILE